MNKLSPTIGFDIDRGDRATRMRELSVKLVEWGWEMAAPILFAFEKFMAGKPGDDVPKLEHVEGLPPGVIKIMTGELLQMIEHQKANAKHALEKSEKNRQSARKRWDADNANAYPKNANATSIDKETEEEQVPEGKGLVSSSLTCPTSSVGSESQLPSAGACAGARPAAVESGHAMRTATIAAHDGYYGDGRVEAKTFSEADLRERPVQYVLDLKIDEEENRARPFYMKALQQLGPDIYANTCWRFIEAYVKAENDFWKAHEASDEEYNEQEANRLEDLKCKYQDGGPILSTMLKEAGAAHGIDLGAKRTKKGGE